MRIPFIAMPLIAVAAITIAATSTAEAQSRQDRYDDAECQSYGAVPGSEAYVGCRLRLKERVQEQIRRAFDRPPVYIPPPPVRMPTPSPQNCITNYVGGSAYRTCN